MKTSNTVLGAGLTISGIHFIAAAFGDAAERVHHIWNGIGSATATFAFVAAIKKGEKTTERIDETAKKTDKILKELDDLNGGHDHPEA